MRLLQLWVRVAKLPFWNRNRGEARTCPVACPRCMWVTGHVLDHVLSCPTPCPACPRTCPRTCPATCPATYPWIESLSLFICFFLGFSGFSSGLYSGILSDTFGKIQNIFALTTKFELRTRILPTFLFVIPVDRDHQVAGARWNSRLPELHDQGTIVHHASLLK